MSSSTKIYEKHHSESRNISKTSFGDTKGKLFKEHAGKNKTILEIGCRGGALAKYFLKDNDVYGLDIDTIALKEAKKLGIKTKYLDLNETDDNFDKIFGLKKKFDVIIAGDVIEHIYFPERKIEQVAKSLKKGGLFLGNVPNAFFFMHRIRYIFGSIKGTPMEDPTHITQFSFKHLDRILKKYFSEIEYHPIIDPKFKILTKFSKSLFYYGIYFKAKK